MVFNRSYNRYLYNYTADNGDTFVRQHREFKNYQTDEVLVPVTTLFLETVFTDKRKIDPFEKSIRRLDVELPSDLPTGGIANISQPMPHNSRSGKLLSHITEVNDAMKTKSYEWYCLTYQGERRQTI